MGYRVIGLDVAEGALEEAKHSGAEHVFNSLADADYVQKIQEITKGGVDAAVNFTASGKAYTAMPSIIRPTGILMAVGIPQDPISVNIFDIAMHRYQFRGSNNGTCYTSRLTSSLTDACVATRVPIAGSPTNPYTYTHIQWSTP
jgi:D-arabinose 1-dehydrogenase-like Zn-dependent alcohol dehydrogenase